MQNSGNPRYVAAKLDRVAALVRDALWRLEDPRGGVADDPDVMAELEHYLRSLYHQTAIAFESAGLMASRAELVQAWNRFEETGLRASLRYLPEPGVVTTAAFDHLSAMIDGLRNLEYEIDPMPHENAELQKLERFLKRTALLVGQRQVVPTKEADVQHVMDDYLEAVYGADYHKQFTVPGVAKNFRPDAGVRSLSAAIEFKFCDSQQEVKTAVSDLFEDAAGYKASADWKRFFSVIYMTGAHATEEQLLAAFDLAEIVNWTPILVTGSGARSRRK